MGRILPINGGKCRESIQSDDESHKVEENRPVEKSNGALHVRNTSERAEPPCGNPIRAYPNIRQKRPGVFALQGRGNRYNILLNISELTYRPRIAQNAQTDPTQAIQETQYFT